MCRRALALDPDNPESLRAAGIVATWQGDYDFAARSYRRLTELRAGDDEIDLALDNAPIVGMLAWKSWHLGMLGHGSQVEGGDADELAIIGGHDGKVTGNDAYYATPRLDAGSDRLADHGT